MRISLTFERFAGESKVQYVSEQSSVLQYMYINHPPAGDTDGKAGEGTLDNLQTFF